MLRKLNNSKMKFQINTKIELNILHSINHKKQKIK